MRPPREARPGCYSAALRMRWIQRLRGLSPRSVLAIGFACFVLYGFPGYMSTDSVQQLMEARTSVFSDGHPPLMAAQWWILDRIVAGPLLMLLLQGAVFLGGLYVLLQRVLAPRHAAWTAVGILLFPPVLTTMAVIWKDSQMAAYLVAGLAAMVQPRLRTRIAGLALLVVACATRHNAIAAVAPLVFFIFEWRSGLRWWKRVAVLGGVVVITVGAAFAITRVLAVSHVPLTPVFSDVVGTLAYTDDMTDDEARYVLRGTPLVVEEAIQHRARMLHDLRGAWRLTQGDLRFFSYPRTPEQWAALHRAWKDLVLGDPIAYLASHWDEYLDLLGVRDDTIRAPVWNLFDEGEVIAATQHAASWSRIQYYVGRVFYWLADHTPLFRPYIYAVIGLLLLALCSRDRLTAGLITSGLLYELSYFPVGANPDYRYSHWLVTTVTIAAVILFIQRRRGRTT